MFCEVATPSKTTTWAVLAGSCAWLAITCPIAAAVSGAEEALMAPASPTGARANCESSSALPSQPRLPASVLSTPAQPQPQREAVSAAHVGHVHFGSADLLALGSIACLWTAARLLQRLRKPRRRTRPARWVERESHPPGHPRTRRASIAR